jgi:hypothetical protein
MIKIILIKVKKIYNFLKVNMLNIIIKLDLNIFNLITLILTIILFIIYINYILGIINLIILILYYLFHTFLKPRLLKYRSIYFISQLNSKIKLLVSDIINIFIILNFIITLFFILYYILI